MRRRHLVAALLFALATVVVLWQLGDQGRSATLLRVVSLFVDSTGEPTGALDLLAVPLFLLLGAPVAACCACADIDGTRRTSGATAAGCGDAAAASFARRADACRRGPVSGSPSCTPVCCCPCWRPHWPGRYCRGDTRPCAPWAIGSARACAAARTAHGRMTQSGKGAPVPAAASDAGGTGRVVLALFDAALRAGDVRIRRSALRTLAAIAMPVIAVRRRRGGGLARCDAAGCAGGGRIDAGGRCDGGSFGGMGRSAAAVARTAGR